MLKPKRTAFTLAEMLIATAIFVVLFGTIFSLLQGGIQAYRRSEVLVNLEEKVSALTRQMSNDYRQAYFTSSPGILGSANILMFRRYESNGNNPLITYTFNSATGTLTRQVDSGTVQTVATDVGLLSGQSYAFTRINPNTVFVNFSVRADAVGITNEASAAWRTAELITNITTHGENQLSDQFASTGYGSPGDLNRRGIVSLNGRGDPVTNNPDDPNVYGGLPAAIANPGWAPRLFFEF